MPKIVFINGPNANLYGLDPSGTYGSDSFATIEQKCRDKAAELGIDLEFLQSNHEGQIIDWIQAARRDAQGIIINAAGLTYTSIAILDALMAFDGPILECHMSNIHKREPFRHHSYISKVATGIIAGLGLRGYLLALAAMGEMVGEGA
ncbi:type II 3-dehydroquinate dehydratase [Vannielia litorea]|uniref:3-dehydroquinate dehydratase n=1 Tax=Vannielia litorea TaxID=1217970 RepID=A0A1N6EMP2_9RHOB|nr:type II 3-dehydroquinate dehydratase [Vannielia litorea]SIN84230.1 3-dehydroquinate dehydratase [Vannielia litorea]